MVSEYLYSSQSLFSKLCFSDQLKIWSLRQQQQKEEEANRAGSGKKKVTAAQLRVQKDLTELSLPSTMKTVFADPQDIMNFELVVKPDDGIYKGGTFRFSFNVNSNFPHEPPKVKCLQKVGEMKR